ncbi:biopolymer transporter ExbD [Myxococcota bacterium]|nr:biopolymer transporter ExbD [Myxococcota bacterium]
MAFEVGTGGARRIRPVMNVTPLVDVVLVLLIIFMVITPLLSKQFATNVPLPDKSQTPPPENTDAPPPAVLRVVSGDEIRLNDAVLADADFERRIARVMAAQAEPLLFFTADEDVPHGRVVELMDRARGSGARRIAVLTETP